MFSGLENPVHLLILFVIVLLVFGPKRLPQLGRSLGRGIREFRGSVTGSDEGAAKPSDAEGEHEHETKPQAPAP